MNTRAHGRTGPRILSASSSAAGQIVFASSSFKRVLEWASIVGRTNANVLITGETGTGKELLARVVHENSTRKHAAFVPLNCGSLSEGTADSELFGHRRGAFTSADRDRIGLLASAHSGTLFLDELGELPLRTQPLILRFLDHGEIRRVGDSQPQYADVRLVSATNRSLENEVDAGRFRRDLFHRIAHVTCRIPPLRERPEDVRVLVERWLPILANQLGVATPTLDHDAMEQLQAHSWPGNARELRNAITKLCLLAPSSGSVNAGLLGVILTTGAGAPAAPQLDSDERSSLLAALTRNEWKREATAVELRMSRTTLWRRMRTLGMTRR